MWLTIIFTKIVVLISTIEIEYYLLTKITVISLTTGNDNSVTAGAPTFQEK